MIDPTLDLSVATLMELCKGNVKMLPSFMVHDDTVWTKSMVVQTDSLGRIHMRRSTFNRTVAGKLPIREGVWHRMDLQEFHIDLKPHHLQGSADQTGGDRRQAARAAAKMDWAGRSQGDKEYGDDKPRHHRKQDIARDVAAAKAAGTSGSVRSAILSGGSTEDS